AGSPADEGQGALPRYAGGDRAAGDGMTRPQHFVDRAARLAACVEDVARSPRIGLDTESNGFHAYFEKVCLLQIATPDADWAVDPLAVKLDPLLPLLADPAREGVLHAAEYDVIC